MRLVWEESSKCPRGSLSAWLQPAHLCRVACGGCVATMHRSHSGSATLWELGEQESKV